MGRGGGGGPKNSSRPLQPIYDVSLFNLIHLRRNERDLWRRANRLVFKTTWLSSTCPPDWSAVEHWGGIACLLQPPPHPPTSKWLLNSHHCIPAHERHITAVVSGPQASLRREDATTAGPTWITDGGWLCTQVCKLYAALCCWCKQFVNSFEIKEPYKDFNSYLFVGRKK